MSQDRHYFFVDESEKPTHEEIVDHLTDHFDNLVGQLNARLKLGRIAYNAMLKPDHNCSGTNYLVTGPASVGKTSLVRTFANCLSLPFLEVNPRSLKNTHNLFEQIQSLLANTKDFDGLQADDDKENYYEAPPMIVFIDESHALNIEIQNGLLKAIENNDKVLQTEGGAILNCKNICWFFATTDVGLLFAPLISRFSSIDLKPYTKKEIAEIVQIHNPELSIEACELIAFYESRIPRKALDFAREVIMIAGFKSQPDYLSICHHLAVENGIDEFGLSNQQAKILNILGSKPVSKERVAMSLQCGKEQLEKLIMPPLLCETEDYPALVTVGRTGYALTEAGKELYLKKNPLVAMGVI
jgi:Holliday junction resolvasome RuvABC ATP-dependent DNA helicase subunit